jgi:SPP1 gp7 family putative phage head morphogenesis protein
MENLVNVLNWRLIPDNYILGFVDPTPEDQENERKNIETADRVNALTINEKREKLGYEPIKGGDEILVPFNLVPINYSKPEAKSKSFNPLKGDSVRRVYGLHKEMLLQEYEKRILKATKKYFNEQLDRILKNMGVIKKSTDLIEQIFDVDLEVSIAKASFLPVLRQVFEDNAKDSARLFNSTFTMTSAVEEGLIERTKLLGESIATTSQDRLAVAMKESFALNESRKEQIERVKELYKDMNDSRANTIARTEIHAIQQKSNLEVYKQAGIETKKWTTVGDERVRPEHQILDGEEVPINGKFSNGLEYPNEVNCRCQC